MLSIYSQDLVLLGRIPPRRILAYIIVIHTRLLHASSSSRIMNPPVTGTSLHTRLLAAASALLSRRKLSYLHPFHTLAGCGGRRWFPMSVGTFRSSYRPYPPPRAERVARGVDVVLAWKREIITASSLSGGGPKCRAIIAVTSVGSVASHKDRRGRVVVCRAAESW